MLHMSDKVRVQDDLYMFVNKDWLDKAVIPDDKPLTGGFSDLATGVEDLLISDFNKMACGEKSVPDENMGKAIKLYLLAKDVKKRNKDGINPVKRRLETLQKLNGIADFNRSLYKLVTESYPLPVCFSVDADMKDTAHYVFSVSGSSCFLPDTTYYKPEMQAHKDALIAVWTESVRKILSYLPLSDDEVNLYIDDALKFDAIIAGLIKSSEEWSEYTKAYNPMPLKKVSSMLKPLKLGTLLKKLYGEALPETVIVQEPRFLKGFKTLFNEKNFTLYKHWAYIRMLLDSFQFLSEDLRAAMFMYQQALSGAKCNISIEKQAYRLTSAMFSQPIGMYYGKTYFGEEAKKDVVCIVREIIDTYKKRLKSNGVLSEETKKKAILKLDKIAVKMGYPDSYDKIYDLLTFPPSSSLYAAYMALLKTKTIYMLSKLHENVDRSLWIMAAHVVNACYNPFTNDITFPAAILQAPFYSLKQTRSQNLGGIGAVIGHEISHAFDNNGAKCDENGNLNNWWTKEDEKTFVRKTKAMAKEFDGIVLDWGTVNGNFIVSENIADNGGMAVTLDIMAETDGADYKEYFYNWARIWCVKAREKYLKLLLQVDVHAPAMLRANMQPRNFDIWYSVFGVKKSDGMYLPPSKRVTIW